MDILRKEVDDIKAEITQLRMRVDDMERPQPTEPMERLCRELNKLIEEDEYFNGNGFGSCYFIKYIAFFLNRSPRRGKSSEEDDYDDRSTPIAEYPIAIFAMKCVGSDKVDMLQAFRMGPRDLHLDPIWQLAVNVIHLKTHGKWNEVYDDDRKLPKFQFIL
jgi:hypothetical protein